MHATLCNSLEVIRVPAREIGQRGRTFLPARRTIPIWFGGHADATLRRIAKMGDGWMMLAHARGAEAEAWRFSSAAAFAITP
jgi:alkanesulfonate monooxygenase SsuD/methylene tetrahydromethanopterin reductase-like flavin-dependent oxidoreductase (luciferase family)